MQALHKGQQFSIVAVTPFATLAATAPLGTAEMTALRVQTDRGWMDLTAVVGARSRSRSSRLVDNDNEKETVSKSQTQNTTRPPTQLTIEGSSKDAWRYGLSMDQQWIR